MKKKLRRILTFMIALTMCAGMMISDLQAADLSLDGTDNTLSGTEERAPADGTGIGEEAQAPEDVIVPEPPAEEEPMVETEQPQVQQPQIQQPEQQTKQQGNIPAKPQAATERAPMDEKLAALMSGQATMQGMKLSAEAAAQAENTEPEPTVASHDISTGSIEISEGSYKVSGGEEKTQTNNTYVITGSTLTNTITVKGNAKVNITLKGVTIYLHAYPTTSQADSLPAIRAEEGATISLILDGASKLVGSPLSSGIRLVGDSSVNVQGVSSVKETDSLEIHGGSGAAAIGNNKEAGGRFGVAKEPAKVVAYSDQAKAINTIVNTTVKILQGALDTTLVSGEVPISNAINVENQNARDEKYKMNVPAGFASFATTTSVKGGEYVAYFPQTGSEEVTDSMLLADVNKKYSFSLTSLLTTYISGLVPQKITYSVTFDANTGSFGGQTSQYVTGIGYGTKIQPPNPLPTKVNNGILDWRFDKEGLLGSWNFDVDQVVKDMVLYVNWKPEKCTVTLIPGGGADQKELESLPYGAKIPRSALEGYNNPGFYLDGWYTTTTPSRKWEVDTDVVTKEKMTLKAVWLAPCTVTFNINTKDTTAKNIEPNIRTVPATSAIADPDTGDKAQKPERLNYVFTGWYTSAACTTKWDFSDKVSKSMVLYAGWAAANTTVTLNPGEGGRIIGNDLISVLNGAVIPEPDKKNILKDPELEDESGNMATEYELDGWYTDAKLTKQWNFKDPLSTPDGKLTLYAKWHPKTCWVTLKANDKLIEPSEKTFSVSYKTQLKETDLSTRFSKEGHTITSWNQGTKVWDFATALTGNIILSANWTPEKYDVEFLITEEGEEVPKLDAKESVQTVVYNNPVTKPVYTKAGIIWLGHTFNGWYTEKEGEGTQWVFRDEATPSLVKMPMKLYAYWTLDEYTLTWDYKDGINNPVTDPEQIYYYDELVDEPPVPTRENYEFQGWYTDPTYTEESKWDFETSKMTGSTTLYAKWIGEPRKLILHITHESEEEGGDGRVEIQNPVVVHYGDLLKRTDLEDEENSATKPKLGYTLNGWYTDKEHTKEWTFETDTITENQILYAYWTRNVYQVSFFTYDGDTENKIEDQTSYYGLTVTKPADPVRKHYTFDAWYTDAAYETAWNFKDDTVTDHMTLYAKWIPDIYKLSFETNGGSKLEPIDVTYDTYPPDEALATKKEGYVVKSWYRDKEMTIPFDPKTELVDSNMTIYSEWKLEEYTVKFHYMAAKDSKEEEIIEDEKVYNVGNYVAAPVREIEHKKLSSWYRDPEFSERWVFKRDKIKGNQDLYAYWSDIEYTVHFETYDGTLIEDTKLTWGMLVEKPEDAVRNGYTFTGWFKDSSQKESWDFENDFVEGDTTIYAGWNPNMYEVTFDLNGGTGTVTNQKLLFGSFIAKPDDPTKEGNTFKGWKVAAKVRAAEGENWNFASDTVDGDVSLTAEWEEVQAPDNGNTDNGNTDNGNTDNGNTNNGNTDNGSANSNGSTTGGNTTTGTGANSTTTGTGSNGTTSAAADALKSAAGAVGSILTGDKAPLTYSLVGIFVGAFMIIWALIRKYK